MATLDIRSTEELIIKSDDKNFSVQIAGFTELDSSYTLKSRNSKSNTIAKEFTTGTDITLDDAANPKTLTLSFSQADYEPGSYIGYLSSVPLNRNGVTVSSKEDQKHPSAGLVANETSTGSIELVGQLNAGVVIADVPITVVVQNGNSGLAPTLRSQNGTTTASIINDDDETLSLGWTPESIKAEITEGTDGILYKRVINAGAETWAVA